MVDIAGLVVKGLEKIFGSHNEKVVLRLLPIVELVNAFEPQIVVLSDQALRDKTGEFRKRLADGETLDELLPEAFAAVREASKRALGMRHFDVQILGGIILHQGKIAEMVTGEGKTLVATLSAYLNALVSKVHIVTVNDYLAKRDAAWMAPIFEFLGLTVGAIQSEMDSIERLPMYACDIVYGTNNEFGFDYLRDNMKSEAERQVQKVRDYAIIDEVDSVLVDEARTPLIISGPAEESVDTYYKVERIVKRLKNEADYKVMEKEHSVILTEQGISHAEELLGLGSFYEGKNIDLPHFIDNALKAHNLYQRDREYIVKDGAIVIVDEFTGRLMSGRRWSDGLHQAVEAKEGLKIKQENQTLATITFQNFFKLYKKLSGMTGTAMTEAKEFAQIYSLDVVAIPTDKPLRRINYPDVIYGTTDEKYEAIIDEIAEVHEKGRPILVGTTSIAKSEILSERLSKIGVKHEVLNAKHHEREAQIVAKAGQGGHITIATNMAGRGTDIVLGESVAKRGGLHIIGTERHEARRIDNQLRGRAGRQGDPGSSRFFLSLEDDLMRIFAPERVAGIMRRIGLREGMPIESRLVSRALESAQKKVEEHNFSIRKHLLEYDAVMNDQRKLIYSKRQEILEKENVKGNVLEILENNVTFKIDNTFLKDQEIGEGDFKGFAAWLRQKIGGHVTDAHVKCDTIEEIKEKSWNLVKEHYDKREAALTPPAMRELERFLLLEIIDKKWKDHLRAMDHLRDYVGLRGYASKDPKVEYRREGFQMFEEMYYSFEDEVCDLILKVNFTRDMSDELADTWQIASLTHDDAADLGSQRAQNEEAMQNVGEHQVVEPIRRGEEKIGRNAPCPCGSGKKYKKCCGKK